MHVTTPEMEELDCLRILLSTLALLANTIRNRTLVESWPTGTFETCIHHLLVVYFANIVVPNRIIVFRLPSFRYLFAM